MVKGVASRLAALPLAPHARCQTTMSQKENKHSTHARDMFITTVIFYINVTSL